MPTSTINLAHEFDIFLSYNWQDKRIVHRLAQSLRKEGLRVWLDDWELVAGQPWQEALENVIEQTASVLVAVGQDDHGKWQEREVYACIEEFVRRRLRVIPALLPGTIPKDLPIFLRQFTWVDLRGGIRKEAIQKIVAGVRVSHANSNATSTEQTTN